MNNQIRAFGVLHQVFGVFGIAEQNDSASVIIDPVTIGRIELCTVIDLNRRYFDAAFIIDRASFMSVGAVEIATLLSFWSSIRVLMSQA